MGVSITSIKHGHYDVNRMWTKSPDSAGGVHVLLNICNTDSSRTLKYADIYAIAYNSVGDPVPCSISRESLKGMRVTGPIEPGKIKRDLMFESMWYNPSIAGIRVDHVDVTYMDGSTETVSGYDATEVSANLKVRDELNKALKGIGALLVIVLLFVIAFAIGQM
ncbi:MAG: hypothetical protein NC340_04270 [Ruminococcus flavefaciens]|nr:hypothetical protein [Ruminococcus flavefaciens]MCM1229268.1 hypothetical protein [Ruminococcus flavefaciens]